MTYIANITEAGPGAPLIFTFHGTGGDEAQFHDVARRMRPDATVISPRGDVQEGGANRYFRRTGEGVYDMADLGRAVAKLAAYVAAAQAARGAVETMALGYSNGANILAATAFAHPALFDRMALLHPLIPFAPPPQPALAGKRVLITAGRADPICPAPLTERLAVWMAAQGAEVQTLWHPGGHQIGPEEPGAIAAFLAA